MATRYSLPALPWLVLAALGTVVAVGLAVLDRARFGGTARHEVVGVPEAVQKA